MSTSPVPPQSPLDALQIDDPSPSGIAGAIARLINSGDLLPGDRLPTVRELSTRLGVSPATVSQGWQALARSGLVVARGRSGTFVADTAVKRTPSTRTMMLAGQSGEVRLDLSRGMPDPRLLPEVGAPLATIARHVETANYHEHPVVPELGRLLSATWPTKSDALTIVDGALDAVSRSLAAVARYGDKVVVENPTFPQFLDLIEALGLHPIPVRLDEQGIRPDDFAAALAQRPAAAIIQPRAHNPTGISTSVSRAKELAALLAANGSCIVIEDDHSGPVVPASDLSLGRWAPDRVVHVRSFSKSHGPDLRIAALSGPATVVNAIVTRRALGPGWTPRILQRLLHELLSDPEADRCIDRARREYQRRRRALIRTLPQGVRPAAVGEGLNVWIAVEDERRALVQLAAEGIRVAPGAPFMASLTSQQHIRVTIASLDDDFDDVGRAVSIAAAPVAPRDLFSLR